MKTAENTLNSCGLILTDFVSSSNYDAVIYAMKLYANAKLEEEINKLQELERQSFIGWNKEAKKGYLTLLTTVVFHLEKLKDKV